MRVHHLAGRQGPPEGGVGRPPRRRVLNPRRRELPPVETRHKRRQACRDHVVGREVRRGVDAHGVRAEGGLRVGLRRELVRERRVDVAEDEELARLRDGGVGVALGLRQHVWEAQQCVPHLPSTQAAINGGSHEQRQPLMEAVIHRGSHEQRQPLIEAAMNRVSHECMYGKAQPGASSLRLEETEPLPDVCRTCVWRVSNVCLACI